MGLKQNDLILLQKGNAILAQSANDTKYIVSTENDAKYFSYWLDRESKAEVLQEALDFFRSITEEEYKRKEDVYEQAITASS